MCLNWTHELQKLYSKAGHGKRLELNSECIFHKAVEAVHKTKD